jgi:DNA mismatch repair protein MutL
LPVRKQAIPVILSHQCTDQPRASALSPGFKPYTIKAMPIKVLDSHTVSKIAAGEVIERPASVVKELVENALDAGADSISVETQGGGVSLIRVSDNGSGITAGEVELAFARHATSKLDTANDLERIATLGFRGEALPSIASVADVEILTLTAGTTAGTFLRLEKGVVTHRETRGRSQGTTVTVRHLFRHFPARLKFLKSPGTENSHIATLVTHYALAYPEVRFTLTVDGRETVRTPGSGELRDAVSEVYGPDVAQKMLNVAARDPAYTVTGLVSPPAVTRANRNYLSFFVNRRWVHSSLLIRAVEDAYHGQLMTGKHPIVVLTITLPPGEVDVNVHPAKTEVRFRNSQILYTAVGKPVKAALEDAPVREIGSTKVPAPPQPVLWQEHDKPEQSPEEMTEETAPVPSRTDSKSAVPILRVMGQLSNTYILAEGPDGLYMIDQHAAHERILFEKVLAQRAQKNVDIQGLLEPMTIDLSPRQEEILRNRQELLGEFGLTLEHFGGRSYLLRAVPAVMKGGDLFEAVRSLLDSLAGSEERLRREERIAFTIACHGAVRAGDPLTMDEMRALVRQLEETQQPGTCPHGRPTMIHLSARQLEKEFGRTG